VRGRLRITRERKREITINSEKKREKARKDKKERKPVEEPVVVPPVVVPEPVVVPSKTIKILTSSSPFAFLCFLSHNI